MTSLLVVTVRLMTSMPGSYQKSCWASSSRAPEIRSSTLEPRWPPAGRTESRRGAVAHVTAGRSRRSAANRIVGLGQEPFGNFAVLDDFHGARAGHQSLFIIDSEQLIKGCGVVLHIKRIAVRFAAGGVGAAMDVVLFDAAAGHDDAEHFGIMIAAGGFVDLGGAAEFGGDQDERGVEHAAAGEVTN